MREILFRGQTRRKGERVWMDGSPVESNWVYGGVFQGPNRSIIYSYEPIEKHTVYTETVGQFTGLLDKNGKKIFEGDIVQYFGTCPLEVCIEKGHPKIRYFDYITNSEQTELFFGADEEEYGECEIIGNIHDNPELLGGD